QDARAHYRTRLGLRAVEEFVRRHRPQAHVQIETVNERARESRQVTLYLLRRAPAATVADAVISTRAGIERADDEHPRRQTARRAGARDVHHALFEWLAQDLERLALELGQFVEEKDAVMRQRDLARPDGISAA